MGMVVLFNKLHNMTADFVARATHGQAMIQPCRRKDSRTFNRPRLPPERPRKDGAGPFLLPFAQRDDVLESLPQIRVHTLGLSRGDLDTDLPHRSDGLRVQAARFRSGAP